MSKRSRSADLKISDLKVSPFNVRKTPVQNEEFDANIKSLGVLEPLVVRRVDKDYEVIVGQCRFEAAKKAGIDRIRCNVHEAGDMSDRGAMLASLSENIARHSITPMDKAIAIAQLLGRDDLLGDRGILLTGHEPLTVRALATLLGVGKTSVDSWLEPLRLQPETLKLVEEKAVPMLVATEVRRSSKTPEDEVELAQEIAKVDADVRVTGHTTGGPRGKKHASQPKLRELLNKPLPKEKIVETLHAMRDTPIVRKEPEEEEVVPDDWVSYSYVDIGGHQVTDEKLVDRLNRNYIHVAEHAEDMLKLWLDLRGYY